MSDFGDLLILDEVLARAELEPTLYDIYVEGRSDAVVFESLFGYLGLEVSVFAVADRIAIRREEVQPYSADYGNKDKLIAAAALTQHSFRGPKKNLLFVIDNDWISVTGPYPIYREFLEISDLPSMEHYFLRDPGFQRFLSVGLKLTDLQASQVRSKLEGALRDIAAARLVLRNHQIGCIDKVAALCDFKGSPTSANISEIVKRSAARNGDGVAWQALVSQIPDYRSMLEECDHGGRGHDIAPLLIALLKLKGHFADVEVVEAMMRVSVTPQELLAHPFFERVVERTQS